MFTIKLSELLFESVFDSLALELKERKLKQQFDYLQNLLVVVHLSCRLWRRSQFQRRLLAYVFLSESKFTPL